MATLRTLTDLFNPEIAISRMQTGTTENGPALTGRIVVTDPSLLGAGSSGIASVSVSTGVNGATTGRFGTLVLSADRNASADVFDVEYTYTPTASLRRGEIVSDVFMVTARDGAGRTVTMSFSVAVTGVNDNPVLSAVLQPVAVLEADGTGNTPVAPIVGSLSVQDVDVGDTLTAQVVGSPVLALSGGGSVPAALQAVLLDPAAFTLGAPIVANGNAQAISFTYDPNGADLDLNFLAAGQTLTVTYQVRVADNGGGASATRDVTFTFAGTNDDPVLAPTVAVALTDTSVDDDFTTGPAALNLTGTLQATDADGAAFTYGIEGVDPDEQGIATLVGEFGTLVLDTVTGNYEFTVNDAAVEGLSADDLESFTVTVTDDAGATVSRSLDIIVSAVNDAPTLAAPAATAPQPENNSQDAGGNTNLPALNGILAVSDAEIGSTLSVVVNSAQLLLNGAAITPTNSGIDLQRITDLMGELVTGRLTTSTVTANGQAQTIDYTYDAAAANLNFLRDGDVLSILYGLQVSDGAGGLSPEQTLTFTVSGTNDTPVLEDAGVAINLEAEEADTTGQAQTITGSGTVVLTDRDRDDALSIEVSEPAVTLGGVAFANLSQADRDLIAPLLEHGALTVTPTTQSGGSGDIVFSVAYTATANLDFLAEGEILSIRYTLNGTDSTADSASRDFVITLTGTNDAPVLAVIQDITYTDLSGDDTFDDFVGSVSAADPDGPPSYGVMGDVSIGTDGIVTALGRFGTLELNSASGEYVFRPNSDAIQGVNGEVVDTFTFTITANDGMDSDTQTLRVVVNGANDTAVFAGTVDGLVTEDSATANTTGGTVTVTDRDDGQQGFLPVDTADLQGIYGDFEFDNNTGEWTYTLNNNLAATNALAQGGAQGVDTLTIRSADGTEQALTVTVTGANDAPVLLQGPLYAETGVSFTVVDPDTGATLSLASPRATFFGGGDIANGTETTLTVMAQTQPAADALVVQDEFNAPVNVGYLALGTDVVDGAVDPANPTNPTGLFALAAPGAAYGFGGDDAIIGSTGDDFIFGGEGNDFLLSASGLAGSGHDLFAGGVGNDTVLADDGVDTIQGGSGDDVVESINLAVTGADSINLADSDSEGMVAAGESLFDTVTVTSFGQTRVSFISGQVGNGNVLSTGAVANPGTPYAGENTGGLAVRLQNEDAFGELIGDIARADDEGISFVSASGGTFDVRDFQTGAQRGDNFDVVTLGTSRGDEIDESGEAENYYINAGGGDDKVFGGDGDDFLVGGAGSDTLTGNAGDDKFIGGAANDVVDGGDGFDTFIQTSVLSAASFFSQDGAFSVSISATETDTLTGVETVVAGPAGSEKTFLLVGNGGYATIQAAIDAAAAGDTIVVAAGTFNEDLVVNKALTIVGNNVGNSGNAIRNDESVLNGTITLSADGVTLDGFKVAVAAVGATPATQGVNNSLILIQGGNATVQNMVIERSGGLAASDANNVAGIRVQGTGADIVNNLIRNPGADLGGFGAARAGFNQGVYGDVPNSSDMNVSGNSFVNLRTAVGADYVSAQTIIDGNEVSKTGSGVSVGSPSTISDFTAVITNNQFDLVPGGTGLNLQNLAVGATINNSLALNTGTQDGVDALTILGSRAAGSGDNLSGGAINEILLGQAGNDSLYGGGGNDTLSGGTGVDFITPGTEADRVESSANQTADADVIYGFVSGADKFDYNGTITLNGDFNVVSSANISDALTNNQNAEVFIRTATNLGSNAGNNGVVSGLLNTLATSTTEASVLANYATFEAALVGANGVLNASNTTFSTALSNAVGLNESILLVLGNGTHSVALRYTNLEGNATAATRAINVTELELVGVFNGTAQLAVGDFV